MTFIPQHPQLNITLNPSLNMTLSTHQPPPLKLNMTLAPQPSPLNLNMTFAHQRKDNFCVACLDMFVIEAIL